MARPVQPQFRRTAVERRILLQKRAKDIPDAKALEIILKSFPKAERAGLLDQIRPQLRFTVD